MQVTLSVAKDNTTDVLNFFNGLPIKSLGSLLDAEQWCAENNHFINETIYTSKFQSGMNLQEFKNKYLPLKQYQQGEPALADVPESQNICLNMINDTFPTLNAQLIVNTFMGLYHNAAIKHIYDGLRFSLQSGWFEIGLDKASFSGTPTNPPIFAVQSTDPNYVYHARIFTTDQQTHLLVDAGTHYKKIMIKGVDNFKAALKSIEIADQSFYLNGLTVEYEDIEILNDGFCAIDRETPIRALLETKEQNFEYGNYSYDEKTNSCIQDEFGSPLWVNKALVINALENTYRFKIKYGSKPYLFAETFETNLYFAFYQNQFFSGSLDQIDDWAANL